MKFNDHEFMTETYNKQISDTASTLLFLDILLITLVQTEILSISNGSPLRFQKFATCTSTTENCIGRHCRRITFPPSARQPDSSVLFNNMSDFQAFIIRHQAWSAPPGRTSTLPPLPHVAKTTFRPIRSQVLVREFLLLLHYYV